MVDRVPAYIVKNNRTGKKKVVHRARLLLWLADYGEPVRCNLMDISVVPPGTMTDQYPPKGCGGNNLVPGCRLQYGLDLIVYLAVINDLETDVIQARMRGACGSTSKCSWSNDRNTG